jgi:hypothetical protein
MARQAVSKTVEHIMRAIFTHCLQAGMLDAVPALPCPHPPITTTTMCGYPMQVMFSKPLPDFSCRLNAFATAMTCQWLMGPCKVNDVELDDGRVSK